MARAAAAVPDFVPTTEPHCVLPCVVGLQRLSPKVAERVQLVTHSDAQDPEVTLSP